MDNITSSKLYRPGKLVVGSLFAYVYLILLKKLVDRACTYIASKILFLVAFHLCMTIVFPNSVAYVSRSGGMSNELNNIVSQTTNGVYEGVAIGGDRLVSDHVIVM